VQKNQRNHQNQRTKPVSSSEHGRSNGLEISASNAERICGFHALESVLGQRPRDVLGIWYAHVRSDQRIQTLLAKAEQNQIKTHSTTRRALYYASYFADKTFNPFVPYPILAFYFILLTLVIIGIFGAINKRLNRHLPQEARQKMRLRPNLIR